MALVKPKPLALVAVLVAGCAWLSWNVAPGTLERRMLATSARFIGAVQTGDRAGVLQVTQSELEALEEQQGGVVVAQGQFKVEGLGEQGSAPLPRSFWDPGLLAELGKQARHPASYSINPYPDMPSLTYHFDCRGRQDKCLEHLRLDFTARAGKVRGWIAFWNQPDWRELWTQYYAKGLDTKPCGGNCAL